MLSASQEEFASHNACHCFMAPHCVGKLTTRAATALLSVASMLRHAFPAFYTPFIPKPKSQPCVLCASRCAPGWAAGASAVHSADKNVGGPHGEMPGSVPQLPRCSCIPIAEGVVHNT